MTYPPGIIWTRVVIGVVLTISALSTASAQAPRMLRLNTARDAGLLPEHAYCEVYEEGNISTQIRH